MDKTEIERVKKDMEKKLESGGQVVVTVQKGRNKKVTAAGVIESVHRNVFTILLDNTVPTETPSAKRRVSFSYIDVLTNSVEIA